jgi:hypothetical protein
MSTADITITVTVREEQQPVWARAVAAGTAVVVFAYALGLLWWLAAAAALFVAARVGAAWYRRMRAAAVLEEQRRAAIADRADQQHQWVMAGDPRGVYGVNYSDEPISPPRRRHCR